MLSFRQYLVEYDFDPNIRGMSPTEMGLPTGTGPVRPSISKVGEDADRELMPIIQRLAGEGKLSNIGINSDSEIPKPSEMPLKRLHRLSVAAGEHLDGLDQAVWNIHTHKLVAHHPKENLRGQLYQIFWLLQDKYKDEKEEINLIQFLFFIFTFISFINIT
jgi:hypothetical protein